MVLTDFRAVHLPYCLERLDDGRYVVLNREYKPLGFNTSDFIKYKNYPMIAVRFGRLTQKLAARVSIDGDSSLERIFLYDDGSNPIRSKKNMQEYLKRLELLAKLPITG